ncbi:DEAD/DEAH box helicase [Enterococcus eurekensis]|uniref:DEAD/DEAH box helicase n=1 Tax=Enterococcus eurekensis TaxID=1159753 RepID=A0ABV9M0A0_9ENTE
MNPLRGRQIVVSSEELKNYPTNEYQHREAMILNQQLYCQRCNALIIRQENVLPNGVFFCSECQEFGRIRSDSYLVSVRGQGGEKEERSVNFTWQGKLTQLQTHIAQQLQKNYQAKQSTLLWAVTGSGKTEMVFPVIYLVLLKGGRVCMTSPRIDVCRELYPRIVAAFQEEQVLLLYGNSKEKYRYSNLTICTTHQMLHFYQAFDLIIVDEIDAFPYEGNSVLQFALKNALNPHGRLIYLTATPPNHLLQEVQQTFAIEKSPLRFHQRPLIVPECIWYNHWEQASHSRFHFKKFHRMILELLKDNHVLVFCPSIQFMNRLAKQTQTYFIEGQVASVNSTDPLREEKVQKMREKKYQVLFSTTILERGVTFEDLSVIVMGANHPVYTKSALVQIAGRVDRKGEYRRGRVIFFHNQKTIGMRQACREIKEMNQLAKGWLSK